MPQTQHASQLGFDELLCLAGQQNKAHQFERETGHLPSTMEEAVPFFRALIEKHHAAMLAADTEQVFALREEAHELAVRLNNGNPGILASDEAPACVLERLTAAAPGEVPMWGQAGEFVIEAAGTTVRIELDGIFAIGSSISFWHGFSAFAVDLRKRFISETGYRSFLGLHADPAPGITPEAFVRNALEAHKARELKGKLVAIDKKYRKSAAE